MRRLELIGALAAVLGAAPLMAQGKGKGNDGVPPGQRPVAGMCRIWIDGVPPGKQPAPTDCATAIARRPANARVIFGDDSAFPGKGKSGKQETCTSSGRTATVLGVPIPMPSDDRTVCRDRDDDDDEDRATSRRVTETKGVGDRVKSAGKGKGKGKGGRE